MRIRWNRRRRRGMTLVEVMVSLGLLGGVLLGMVAFGIRLAQSATVARIKANAGQLISDRLEQVKGAPRYSAIDSMFAATETAIPNFAGYTRQTLVTRVGGQPSDTIDYRLITVEVRHPRLLKPMRKTSAIPPF